MVSIKYGWRLKQIPSHCVYGNTFYLQYTLQYPKGEFVTLHHNNIRKTTANLLTVKNEVCSRWVVKRLPRRLQINWIKLELMSVDFWLKGQVAFFDIRIFNPTAKQYVNHELPKSYKVNEKAKKK